MQTLSNMLKGFFIGGSMWVPGVSGGTMAILLGCYDDLIHAVGSFFKDIKKNLRFLAEVCCAAVLGIFLVSKLIAAGLENPVAREPLLCFFVGVVLGGIPFMYRKTKSYVARKRDYVYCLAGLVIVLLIGLIPKDLLNPAGQGGFVTVMLLFAAGIVTAVALVLPGISTTLMLAALGLYETVNKALSAFDWRILVPLALGLLIGTFATTRLLENLMNRYPRKTYLAIIGFVLGSVHQVLPSEMPKGFEIPLCAVTLVLGFFVITAVGRIGEKSEDSEQSELQAS